MNNEIDEEFGCVLTDYNEQGIDMTLVRESLAMTPAERLQVLQEMMNFFPRVAELNGRV